MLLSQKAVSGKFLIKVFLASGSISNAKAISKPAFRNPRLVPPQPQKKSYTAILLFLFILYMCVPCDFGAFILQAYYGIRNIFWNSITQYFSPRHSKLNNNRHFPQLFSEHFLPMLLHKIGIRLELIRHQDRSPFINKEVSLKSLVREIFLEIRSKYKPKILIKSDQAFVKCRILSLRQTESVFRIKPMLRVTTPREDMAGYEKFGDRITGNTTTAVVRGKHALPKESLTYPHLGCCLGFCWSAWRITRHFYGRWFWSSLCQRRNSWFNIGRYSKEGLQALFTLNPVSLPVGIEQIPYFFIALTRTTEPFDSASLLTWIKRSKIAELHGKAARRSSQLLSNFNDKWIPVIKLTKRELAIKVHCEHQLIMCPWFAL